MASHNQKLFTAEDAKDAKVTKVSWGVSDLALFQFLKTFSVAKAGLERGKSSMKCFAGKQEFWI
ncbi:MAG: hypothetical protein DMG65_16140 [Candidatus Angelobacter sp. Gp1-AA117]|nr:MAG: hypothetical protein DMG65_16140 [Candidatus Angelobacter sp. Gp1-AA117]